MMRARNLRKRFGHFRVTFGFFELFMRKRSEMAGYGILFVPYGVMGRLLCLRNNGGSCNEFLLTNKLCH